MDNSNDASEQLPSQQSGVILIPENSSIPKIVNVLKIIYFIDNLYIHILTNFSAKGNSQQ